MGGLIHEIHLGENLPSKGENTWAGNASALVCLARNLRSLTLLVWNDGVVISASLHRADTLRHLTINIKTTAMMQSMLDSVDWINRLTHLEELDVWTEDMDDVFDMTSIQIPVLRLPALKVLRLLIQTVDDLLLFFARAQLSHLHTVACYTIDREYDGPGVLEFFQAHQQVQCQLVGAEFLIDPEVIGSIKANTLRIRGPGPQNDLPLYFAELLSPSVKTLLLEEVDEYSVLHLWIILDGLVTSSSVCAVHVPSTRRYSPSSVQPFRWVVDFAQPHQDWEIMMHSRMVSYVPILAKRGIALYDCDERTLKDYL
jgi:hypothetical protein